MEQRLSIVTLGVEDIAASRAFYESLGWNVSSASNDSVVFIQMGGVALGLYGREALAEDANVPAGEKPKFAGIALAHNARSEAEVDEILGRAEAVGATILKMAEKVFWGGYSGYFSDPDGYPWEVAFNPFFEINEKGELELPI